MASIDITPGPVDVARGESLWSRLRYYATAYPLGLVGAAIMSSLGRLTRFPPHVLARGLILAGGAGGIAAAFNAPIAGAPFAVAVRRRDDQRALAADVHAHHALVPSPDDAPGAKREGERGPAVAGTVESGAVRIGLRTVVEPPGVMDADRFPGDGFSASALFHIDFLQLVYCGIQFATPMGIRNRRGPGDSRTGVGHPHRARSERPDARVQAAKPRESVHGHRPISMQAATFSATSPTACLAPFTAMQ